MELDNLKLSSGSVNASDPPSKSLHTNNQFTAIQLRALVVEANEGQSELVVSALNGAGYQAVVDVVDDPVRFNNHIRSFDYDVIVCDHNLGTWTGLDALELLRAAARDVPFISVSDDLNDITAIEYLKHGAANYIVKHRIDHLPSAVGQALRESARRHKENHLQEQIRLGKRQWELTFDAVPDPVLVVGRDGRVLRANRATCRVFQLTFDQVIGRFCAEVIGGSAFGEMSPLQCGEERDGDYEEPHTGRIFQFSTTPLQDVKGTFIGCVHVLRDVTTRRRAEQALKNSEMKFASLFRSSPDSVALTTFDVGRFAEINDQFSQLTGYARHEVLGRTSTDVGLWPHDHDRAELLEKVRQDGRVCDFERQLRIKSGEIRTVLFCGERANIGGEEYLVAVIRDVTEQKKVDRALRRQALTFEHMHDAVVVVDRARKIVDWNPAAAEVFGYTREEAVGKDVLCLHPREDIDSKLVDLAPSLDRCGKWTGELDALRKDGTRIVVETTVVPLIDDVGVRIGNLGVSRDITDRKRAETALRESDVKFKTLLDSTAEAIYGIDRNGNCTFCNPACVRLLGYPGPEVLLGQNMHTLMHHTRERGEHYPVEECKIYSTLHGGLGSHVDTEVLWRADGTSFHAEYWSYPLRQNDEIIGAVVTFLDITERRRSELALHASEEKYRLLQSPSQSQNHSRSK